ncbi:MAG: Fur family transcriptional regulator [Sulfurovum sp. FS08-3]|nr:MAG: Fur family transcriptional regulator [Sulfurovum sp. FS08-3]
MKDYESLLKAHRLKSTFQRVSIIKAIDKAGHISIDDIYKEIVVYHPSISLATVYKNILTMKELGLVVEVPIANSKSKYELIKENHIHFICQKCGNVKDKPITDKIQHFFEELVAQDAFKLLSTQNNLYGMCHHCDAS